MQALSIRNLKKTYRNGLEALKGIDLDVEDGDFFALLGPNGAGKSTTIGLVSSLVNKTQGSIRIFGHDLDQEPGVAKRLIGLVPQEINFNQFDSVQNVVVNQAGYQGIPRGEALERTEACLKQLGLWDKRHSVSRTLSGGMKRRLMIARALVHGPKLLILDEPTAGVDIEIRRSMWEFLRKINAAGTTIILTTHYLEEAEQLCRNIAIIHHGMIVEHNSMTRLLAKMQVSEYLLELRHPLELMPEIEGFVMQRVDPTTLSVRVPSETGVHALFKALLDQGIEVVTLRNASNRLEQFFLDLMDQRG